MVSKGTTTSASLFAVIIASLVITTAIAAYWVYSNVVTVSVSDYTLTLAETHNGLAFHLTGNLKDPSNANLVGAQVVIYQTDASGNVLGTLGTTTTDASGNYALDWQAPSIGTYSFKSGYQVTP